MHSLEVCCASVKYCNTCWLVRLEPLSAVLVQFTLAHSSSEGGQSGDKVSMGVNQSTSRLGHLQMEAALRLLTGVTDAIRGVRVYPFHHDHAIAPSQHQSGSRVECPSSGVHFDGCIFGETNDTPTVFNRGRKASL